MREGEVTFRAKENMKVGEEESDHASKNGGSFFKAFLKSSCSMYLDNKVMRPINNLENKWFELNKVNKRLSN